MNYQQILENIYQEIQPYAGMGKQADYIPALAKINPDQFGMCIHTIQGETFLHGQAPHVSPFRVFQRCFRSPCASAWKEIACGNE